MELACRRILAFSGNLAASEEPCRPRRTLHSVRQHIPNLSVMHLRCRRFHAVHGATLSIHADVCLHGEVNRSIFVVQLISGSRLDQLLQPCPRRGHIHLREKRFTPRPLLLPSIGKAGKSRLFRHRQSPWRNAQSFHRERKLGSYSDLPWGTCED